MIVSGRVQGVCFRAYTQKKALAYGIHGYVKNKEDGTVEIIAYAEKEPLKVFIDSCHKGPIMAKVKNVEISDYHTDLKFNTFEIR